MGGLVVREALNNYSDKSRENRAELFISIATLLVGTQQQPPAKNMGSSYYRPGVM